MSIILNIETATKNCSVSLAKGGKTIICEEIATENFSHAEKLHVFIDAILEKTNLTFKNINAVAVSQGPGSYTGLRIGVSSAKGLCYALGLPMIAIDTLELLARRIKIENGIIIPMIDARRMEVYTSFFDKNHLKIRETKAEIIDESTYNEINDTMHLVGDGALKFKETLTTANFIFYDEVVYPSANEMSALSFEKYKKSDFVDVAYFEPFYLKDFVLNK
ncbi:tRNA (adenosine(37)-N6)-threonylcarbamoyltransferase complex dimerization subunit type 1 TsaB [Flavobacterium jejuense]|uniref:tRNA (Adenosine(37)-N6)-threonylcarbamoyltransferase complex dimerization subunit type 1 TsaB n=1 Tax=Flavobacterium jejuense TaxID=1544455 RepID=A0ABX0J0L8_9FLAO|nr:tRNA (adenosine(37)-N6)-threonylcarbamoyltransferase complex dimerization subunit type 1 TsaB [Flavobacterium jejuense]NHN27495.1 tRNA (adenosine(37)-N6)-threonylcarbamoyltransferase complex dimerization subunit type 1 TsaB [Flavobacterium jejuense]